MKAYSRFVSAVALLSLIACSSKQVEYLPFQESEGGNWGLIDRKGNVLFTDEFENEILGVSEGVLRTTDDDGNYQFYTVEKKPKLICEGYKDAGNFNGGFAPIVMKDEWIKFINKKGKIVSELKEINGLQVEWISSFHYGMAIYRLEDGSRGLIDNKGTVLTAPMRVGIDFCTEDNFLSSVVVENENLIIEYSDATILIHYKDFIDGKIDKALYRLDKEKHNAYFYRNSNYYCVSTKNKHIIMDGRKEILTISRDSKNSYIYDIKGKYLLFGNENGDKKGIMDMKGNIVIRPKYGFLTFIDEKMLFCSAKGKDIKIIDVKDNVVSNNVDIHEAVVYGEFTNSQLYDGIVCLINEDEEYYFANKQGEPINDNTYYTISDISIAEATVASDFFNVKKLIRELEITETGTAGFGFNTTLGEFIELDVEDLYYEPDEDDLLSRYYNEDELEYYKYINGLKLEIYASFSEPIVTRVQGYKDWNENCELKRILAGFMLTGEYEDKGEIIFDGLYDYFMGKCVNHQTNSDADTSFLFGGEKEVRLIYNKENNSIVICYFP